MSSGTEGIRASISAFSRTVFGSDQPLLGLVILAKKYWLPYLWNVNVTLSGAFPGSSPFVMTDTDL